MLKLAKLQGPPSPARLRPVYSVANGDVLAHNEGRGAGVDC